MTAPPADTAFYTNRSRAHAARRDAETRLSTTISRLRLAAFLPAAACLVWAGVRGVSVLPLATATVLLMAFAILVVWHARVDERAAMHDALRLVNDRAVARIARAWTGLPSGSAPDGLDVSAHPYAQDLDLFGRASLFQWLGPAATVMGSRTLAAWLLRAAPSEEAALRQEAVGALEPLDEWREWFSALGVTAEGARHQEIARFLQWAEGTNAPGFAGGLLRVAVALLAIAIISGGALQLTGVTDGAFWLVPLVIGVVLSFAYARRIQDALDRAGSGQHALARYAELLEHAVHAPSSGRLLGSLRERLSAEGAPAPACMRRLNRILGYGELRRSAAILHFPVQALTLWDFHVIFALERWRRHTGARVRGWLDALAELDALAMFASVRRANPDWCMPSIGGEPIVDAVAIGHPLIPDGRRVANDVRVGPPGTLLLVTGSNMSGKSTLLRAIGLNAVLAQAGSAVCARRFAMPASDLQTSIRVQDSLELGMSYFMAALARLKGVVDSAEHERGGRVLLYLLDEILQGTNSAERGIAVRAVARHLLAAGAIGAMTTHDLNVASEEPLAGAAVLVHFTETVDDQGVMGFDYRLRPGLATSRNALRLMKLIGIDL